MKTIVPLAALAALTLSWQPAQAQGSQEGPWCLKMFIDETTTSDQCNFRTFEACRDVLRGQPSSWCTPNPYYRAAAPSRKRTVR